MLLLLSSLLAACATTDDVAVTTQADIAVAIDAFELELVADTGERCPDAQLDPYCMAMCTETETETKCSLICGCVPLENTDADEEVSSGEVSISEAGAYRAANLLAMYAARARWTYVKIIGPDRQIIGPDHEIIGPDHGLLRWIELDGKLGYREHVARLRAALVEETATYGHVGVELHSRH